MPRPRQHFDTLLAAVAGASLTTALLVRGTLRVPISDSITHPRLVATLPSLSWWLAALVGLVVGGWLGRRLAGRVARNIWYPLLLPGLANLAYIPGAIAVVPFLSSVSGPLLDLLIVGSVVMSFWRVAASLGWKLAPTANLVALGAFALYLLVGYRVQQSIGLTGDEPHYMLIAESLLRDNDLAVADDYAEESFRAFYSGKIGPHLAHGTPYSVHGVGLPLLLLPGYALLGLTGVLLTKAALGGFAVRELHRAVEPLSDRATALVATLGFGATVPGLFLLTAAYPELPAAVLTIAVFRRWVVPEAVGALAALLWGLGLGLLPLLHIKFVTLTAVLALGSLIFWPARRREVIGAMSVALLAILIFFHSLTGNLNPLAAWGTQRIFWQGIPLGLAGLFFDQEAGLLPAAPFFAFALVSLLRFSQRRPALGFLVASALAALALPAAAHPAWAGGASAPARYLFPALPLLAATAAAAWRWEPERGMARWARSLLIASVLFAAYAALFPGQYLYLSQKDGTGRLWEALGSSWDLTHYLPSLVRADPRSLVMAGVGCALFVAACMVQLSSRALRWPSGIAVVLCATVAIDFFSPGSVPAGARTARMERLAWDASQHQGDRFVMLPAAHSVRYEDVLALIDLPLDRARPIALPAGEFVLEADSQRELELCNGEGCFERIRPGAPFQTRVGLARFHLGVGSALSNVHLRASRLEVEFDTSLGSIGFANGLRLHALDDHVFVEPRGIWVRGSSRARLALEQAAPSAVVALVNGGVENWVVIDWPGDTIQFSLRPSEAKRLEIPLVDGLNLVLVESSTGFRPVDQDPSSTDARSLGVFVTTR